MYISGLNKAAKFTGLFPVARIASILVILCKLQKGTVCFAAAFFFFFTCIRASYTLSLKLQKEKYIKKKTLGCQTVVYPALKFIINFLYTVFLKV